MHVAVKSRFSFYSHYYQHVHAINGQVLTLVMITSFSSTFIVTRARLAMLRYKDECDTSVFQVKFKVEFTSQVVNFP